MGSFSSKSSATSATTKKVQVTSVDRAVLDLKNARDRLQRYRKKLEHDDIKLIQQAQKAKSIGNTQTALNILRLRKFKKIQMESCEEQLLNILKMVETIDSKRNDVVIVQAMAAGKDALKKLHEETTIDDIIQLMEQITDEHSIEEEISTIICQNIPLLSDSDEEQLEAELEAMMTISSTSSSSTSTKQHDTVIELPDVPTEPIVPIAPTVKPTKPITEEYTTATTSSSSSSSQQPTTTTQRVAVPG